MAVKTAQTPKRTQGGLSKMEGVRRALSELGKDAKPARIQGFVKERFGIEMSTDVVSTYKGDIARKAAKAAVTKSPVTQPVATMVQTNQVAPTTSGKPAAVHRTNGEAAGIGLTDILAVKDLVTRVGANNLRTLIDVMNQ
jgi:hypothetical protein